MPSLGVRFLVAANRLLPAPSLPGDADPLAYAAWEYETASSLVEAYRSCADPSVRRALDVGCGLGGKTHRLREETGNAVDWTGLDISARHLTQARDYHRHVGVDDVALVASDAAALPFDDAHFDRIVSADALEHLPDPRAALRELRRCVRDYGRVILLFNPWGSPRGSHLADIVHLPWCQLLFDRPTLEEATLTIGEGRARAASNGDGERIREHTRALVDHFRHHVHETRIADLRRWLEEDRTFSIERSGGSAPAPCAPRRGCDGAGVRSSGARPTARSCARPR